VERGNFLTIFEGVAGAKVASIRSYGVSYFAAPKLKGAVTPPQLPHIKKHGRKLLAFIFG